MNEKEYELLLTEEIIGWVYNLACLVRKIITHDRAWLLGSMRAKPDLARCGIHSQYFKFKYFYNDHQNRINSELNELLKCIAILKKDTPVMEKLLEIAKIGETSDVALYTIYLLVGNRAKLTTIDEKVVERISEIVKIVEITKITKIIKRLLSGNRKEYTTNDEIEITNFLQNIEHFVTNPSMSKINNIYDEDFSNIFKIFRKFDLPLSQLANNISDVLKLLNMSQEDIIIISKIIVNLNSKSSAKLPIMKLLKLRNKYITIIKEHSLKIKLSTGNSIENIFAEIFGKELGKRILDKQTSDEEIYALIEKNIHEKSLKETQKKQVVVMNEQLKKSKIKSITDKFITCISGCLPKGNDSWSNWLEELSNTLITDFSQSEGTENEKFLDDCIASMIDYMQNNYGDTRNVNDLYFYHRMRLLTVEFATRQLSIEDEQIKNHIQAIIDIMVKQENEHALIKQYLRTFLLETYGNQGLNFDPPPKKQKEQEENISISSKTQARSSNKAVLLLKKILHQIKELFNYIMDYIKNVRKDNSKTKTSFSSNQIKPVEQSEKTKTYTPAYTNSMTTTKADQQVTTPFIKDKYACPKYNRGII